MWSELGAFDTAFPRFALSVGAAGLLLLLATTIYVLLTPWKELRLVREGNTAAGVALGGAMIGLAIPIAATLAASLTLTGLAIWGAVALLIQLITYRLVDLLLHGLPRRIANDEVGAAALLAAAKVSTAIILGAGVWDPVLRSS